MRRTSRPAAWKSFRTVDLTSLLITTGLSRTIPPRLEHSDEPLLSPIPDHEAWELIHVRPGRDRLGTIRAGKGKSFLFHEGGREFRVIGLRPVGIGETSHGASENTLKAFLARSDLFSLMGNGQTSQDGM